jgi:hypothetical protein
VGEELGVSQVVERLPSKSEALNSNSSAAKNKQKRNDLNFKKGN